jgi:hypothetical protein
VDQIIVQASASLAPQSPGNGIKERTLTGSVFAGQTGDVNIAKIEDFLALVGHKIL